LKETVVLNRRVAMATILATMIFAALSATPAVAQENVKQENVKQEKIKAVATFSILADLVRNVGGERVDVVSLVPANGDAHVYAPTPADAKTLADAQIVFTNGLGFEGWIARLVKSSASKADIVVATKGIKPLKAADDHGHGHSHGSDPHAWQSVANAKIYVGNIRDALVAKDPLGRSVYEANAAAYLAELDRLDAEVREAVGGIPAERRRVITTHGAFGYFAAAYGVDFIAPQGVSTDSEASAKDVARIIAQVKKQKIPAVFLENVSDPRLLKRISEESGAKLGGTLYSDALTGEKGAAPTYIDMIRYNIRTLSAALMS
jgi:zinc/manganese transport system substrate-binding protein